jgi:hypothetical protein
VTCTQGPARVALRCQELPSSARVMLRCCVLQALYLFSGLCKRCTSLLGSRCTALLGGSRGALLCGFCVRFALSHAHGEQL